MIENAIVLATPSPAYEQRVRQAFRGELNGELRHVRSDSLAAEPAVAAKELAADRPLLVAIGPDVHLEVALDVAAWLDRDHPEVCVVLVAEPNPALWQHALRAGIRDILPPDASDGQLRESFERAVDTARSRRARMGAEGGEPRDNRVITVVSPKGGSGKTTVATNLAVGLARTAPGEVVLVDLDVQFGDCATALSIEAEHSFADAARSAAALDAMALKVFLASHDSGLYVLCAPDSPAEGERVTAEQAERVLALLADEFRYVVVDTSAGISEHTLASLEVATDLLLLCSMDVPSIRSLRKEVAALDELGMTGQRRHFVLNRADARVGLDPGDIETTVGLPIDAAVPSSRSVPIAMNQGSPLLDSDPRSPAARALTDLVTRFTRDRTQEQTTATTGLRRWVRSGR